MKGKKILALLMAMLLVVTALVTLVACTDGNVNGTYYLFKNEKIQKDSFITLDGSTWKDENGDSGSYTVSGKAITLYVELLGEKVEYATGSISNGVLTITIMGEEIVYCKEGKEPSSGGGNDKPPVTIKYSVTYDANKGIFKNNISTLVTSDLASQSLLTAPESPTRDGYNFSGWSKSKNKSDMWNFATDKITSNITLYAVWQQESATIFSMEGASINGKKIFMLVDSATDSVSLSNKIVCSEDSTWRLYYDKLGQMEIPTKIAASRNGELVDGNNVFYIVVTSSNGTQVNVYELTIHRSYEASITYYDGEIVLHNTSIYTSNILKESDLYNYEKTGYTFNNWKTSAGQKYVSGEVWSCLSLYADMTANDYTVTLNTNGGDELTNKTKTVTYDSVYTLPIPTKKGHAFDGWYLGGTKLTDGKGKAISPWKYMSNKELTAKWEIKQYKVTLESNYATAGIIKGAGVYNFGSNIKISAAEYKWYKFIGWYNGSTLITDKTEYGFTLDDNDVKYTAKFEPVAEMANFNFTATPTSCSITSVKDKNVKSITVPNYVTGYSDGAFYGCTALESLSFPINSNGFKDLFKDNNGKIEVPKSLKSVIISNDVTSIGEFAFYNCSSLTSITIPDSVTSIGDRAFSGCSSLASVTIPDSVTSIGRYAFRDCSSLTSVIIPDSVTSIGENAFSGCSSLASITLPFVGAELGGTKNTHFGYIFGDYKVFPNDSSVPKSLKKVIITGGESIGVSAFSGCRGLTSVTIPNSVTSIGIEAFYNCSSLTSVIIPDSVTSIGYCAFSGCYALAEVYNLSSLNIIKGSEDNGAVAYYALSVHTSLNEPSKLSEKDGMLLHTDGNNVTLVEYVGDATSVIIPDSVTSIGWGAFSGCSSLTSITIPDSVTSIGDSSFSSCSSLTSITIPDSVKSIGDWAFYNCSGLTSVTIGNSVTSIGNWAFDGCYALAEVYNLSNLNITKGSTNYGYVAYYALDVYTSLSEPSKLSDKDGMILHTNGNNITLVRYIGNKTNVVIPNKITSIGSYAFSGCSGLTGVTIPSSVTSIGNYAFAYCSGLTSITIPDSVTSIGVYAFSGCNGFISVTFENMSGWFVSTRSGATSGTDIIVIDPSQNAKYLKDIYKDFYWKRK